MDLYKIIFTPECSKKIYIGISSKSAEVRFKEHCASRKKYPIVQALKKYGKQNAILTVIATYDDWDSLYEAEHAAIIEHGSKSPRGYNLTDGGKGTFGHPASAERKRKIGEANKGRVASAETRAKISASNRGRDFFVQVEAMRKSNVGRKRSDYQNEVIRKTWIGRVHTQAAKEKMSESASKRRASEETRLKMSLAIKGKKMSEESLRKRKETTERNLWMRSQL
jgi:group I intron endonuclease